MKPEDKPCVKCVYCRVTPRKPGNWHYRCLRLDGADCHEARRAEGACGPMALLFEERPAAA